MIVRLLNTGDYFPRDEYQRHWLEPGRPLDIGCGALCQLLLHRRDGAQEAVLELLAADGRRFESLLTAGYIDARPFSKVFIIPRAAELDAGWQTTRAMLEFVTLDKRLPLEVTPCVG